MKKHSVATQYATALAHASETQGVLSDVLNDSRFLKGICTEAPGVFSQLTMHGIARSDAMSIIKNTFADKLQPLTLNLLLVLIKRSRLGLLAEICDAYEEYVRSLEKKCTAKIWSAIPLPENLQRKVQKKAEAEIGKSIEPTFLVKSSLLGGYQILVENILIDCSIRSALNNLKQTLHHACEDLDENVYEE